MTYDVVVLGEVLVELASTGPFACGTQLRLGVSGDALNAAAAAASAGARTAVLTRVAADELGDMIVARVTELGVDTALIRRVPGQNGAYFVHADPAGAREFVYIRRASAAAELSPADVRDAGLERAGAVLATGVTCALSASAADAVRAAAATASRFVYDPNYRPRLVDGATAAAHLRELAPHAALVTPSHPTESGVLLGPGDPAHAAAACRSLGAQAAAVTCGPDGVWLADETSTGHVAPIPPPRLVDQTGAGDVFAGTVTARLALGDPLATAVRLGTAAASLSLAFQGGCAEPPTLAQTRAHLEAALGVAS
jgi:2-dehydro-3-deoxygluconokinase